jgi:hypothetical protein
LNFKVFVRIYLLIIKRGVLMVRIYFSALLQASPACGAVKLLNAVPNEYYAVKHGGYLACGPQARTLAATRRLAGFPKDYKYSSARYYEMGVDEFGFFQHYNS